MNDQSVETKYFVKNRCMICVIHSAQQLYCNNHSNQNYDQTNNKINTNNATNNVLE